jgi:hypothetical protein
MSRSVQAAVLAIAGAALAAGCGSTAPAEPRPAAAPRAVTMVGCVQPAGEPGRYVLKGLTVKGGIGAPTGSDPGQGYSTETMVGGDAIRYRSDMTPEEWASRITPELVGRDRQIEVLAGHRAVVTGRYTPAGEGQSIDRLEVATVASVAEHCLDR